MLCDEKRALGARNRNTENMLLAFIKIDEIFIPLSSEDMLDMVSSKINLILNYTLSHLIIIVFN